MKLVLFLTALVFLAKAEVQEEIKQLPNEVTWLPKYQKTTVTTRIIGGVESIPHSHPYQVGLIVIVFGDPYFCAGTLISRSYVLTAAHCLYMVTELTAILGAYNVDLLEKNQVRVQVNTSKFHVHSQFDLYSRNNDIATIEFDNPVELNEYIQLVKLPRYSDKLNRFLRRRATVVGWGLTSDASTVKSPLLREVNTTVVTHLFCRIMFLEYREFVTVKFFSHICTSGYGGIGTCDDDSGGPLLIDNKQIGIVSFGAFECESDWPTGYTRVTTYLEWIKSHSDAIILP